jgi:hypothetical protein
VHQNPDEYQEQLMREVRWGILIGLLAMVSIIIYYYFKLRHNYNKPEAFLFTRIQDKYLVPLQKYSSYYNMLSYAERKLFEKRVQKFIDLKQFIPRGMDRVTDEMKALIAGAAIQLMNGFPKIYFAHFTRILIYPDSYYSEISMRYHKGEVNPGGIIVLSWKSFVEGYINQDDGRNLGLHEMAHALRLENGIANEEYGFLDDQALKDWTDLCYHEIDKMNSGESDFFRSYGATNSHEFFAVAVENFFEKPDAFYNHHPKMYQTLARMLKQDPLNRKFSV